MIKEFLFALAVVVLFLQAPSAWAYRFASGSYTGNATDNRNIDISDTTNPSVADFQPDFVAVKCDVATDGLAAWSIPSMGADQSLSFTALASGLQADKIQAFNATGFQVGVYAGVNGSGVTCWYIALATDANDDLAVGTYSGNSTDDRTIDISDTSSPTVADFTPEFVLVQGTDNVAGSAVWKTSAMAGDLTCHFPSTFACGTNHIQALNANGFEVGTNSRVNTTGDTYFYLAIRASSGDTFAGSFTGNATDDRDITSVGFQPEWTLIKGNSTTLGARQRLKDHSGDDSIQFGAAASAANMIQSFLSNGFQVGTHNGVNEDTVTMYHYSIKEQAATATRRPIQPMFLN